MNDERLTYTCTECGGSDVQVATLVDANTGEVGTELDIPPWCGDCEDWTGLHYNP